MTCAGVLFFEGLPRSEAGLPAMEGTAFGELLQHMVEGTPTIPTHAKNGIAFDDDMKFFASTIRPEIGDGALCETKIDWVTRSGIEIRGQYDASFVREGKLYIDDAKYGWNLIEPEENWQLLGYAIGEVLRRNEAFEKIVMRIHQPRPHHIKGPTRTWEISWDELLVYKEKIEARCDQLAAGFNELVTSEKCKYCPAAASACPAFNKAVYSGLDHVLTHHQQDNISEKEISFQLDLLSRAADVLKIKTDSLKELAITRIKDGALIPNYSTEQSFGDRKWKPGISPEVIEALTGKKIVEQKMMSPAQAEKMGVPKDLVKTFVDRHFVGMKLVRKDGNDMGNRIFSEPPKQIGAK